MIRIRQSNLRLLDRCQLAFKLATDGAEADIPSSTQTTLDEGVIFENFLFNPDYTGEGTRKKKDTLQRFKDMADQFRPLFELTPDPDGAHEETWQSLRLQTDKYTLTGEPDYVGNFNGERAIVDVKYCKNIDRQWTLDLYFDRNQVLQSIVYPYMWEKLYGEKLPFYYLIVSPEKIGGKYRSKIIKAEAGANNFGWLEMFIEYTALPVYENPEAAIDTPGLFQSVCLGNETGKSRCWYCHACPKFQEKISEIETLDLNYYFEQ